MTLSFDVPPQASWQGLLGYVISIEYDIVVELPILSQIGDSSN